MAAESLTAAEGTGMLERRMQTECVADGGERVTEAALEGLDDSIELVARANTMRLEPGVLLPVIHSTPCAMHSRQDLPERRLDLLYTTSCHAGKVIPEFQVKGKVTGERSWMQGRSLSMMTNRFDMTPRAGKDGMKEMLGHSSSPRSRYKRPAKLPEEGLTSKDVVMTWLKHGSAPQGEPHFPDITQPSSKVTHNHGSPSRRPNQSALSE